MNTGKIVFSQLTSYLPIKFFRRCVERYRGNHKVQSFTCWDQYLCMAFAQLTYRESLRDIESCLRAMQGKLHHMGIRGKVSKSTLDELILEAGAIYLFDRAYIDFKRLIRIHYAQAFFITRAKSNLKFKRQYSNSVDKSTGIKFDQIGVLDGFYSSKNYPEKIRRIKFYDVERDKNLIFITNNLSLSALTVAQLYKCRWQVEIFFKWIKQHLRIKSFYGTSENAVKTQIWIAISVYVLVAIVKKQLKLEISLYTFLQILSLTVFEKVDILQLVRDGSYNNCINQDNNQLNLFDF